MKVKSKYSCSLLVTASFNKHSLLRVSVSMLLLLIIICMMGCASWRMGAENDVVKNGIRFEAFREYDDGSKMGELASDTVIDGWPCKKDFIVFHHDWRLDELQLSRDYELNGIFMPERTWVFPDAQGNPGICMFPHDVSIQGYLVRGSWMEKEGFMTFFYASGKLKLFYSRDPVTVDGVTCDDSLFHGISLHENGRLQQCKLGKMTSIDRVEYPKGSIISLDQAGKVLKN